MSIPRYVLCLLSVIATNSGVAYGQNYPNKPVRIVTTEPGSGSDFVSRLIAQEMTGIWGQQVIVDNRGGASGAIAAELVAKSTPDGYTLILYGNPLWLLPLFRKNVPYDPVRDFAPITLAVSSPDIIVVHPSLPVKSIPELIAYAKAKPAELNYASSATGGSTHVAAELFKSMAKVDIVRISYRGVGAAVTALIGGQAQVMFAAPAAVVPHIKSGRLRAVAVTSAEPSVFAPGLPTVAASGVPGYESIIIFGIFAPANIPAALAGKLNQDIVRALTRAEVKEKFLNAGMEVVASSPRGLASMVKSEMDSLGRVIKETGIREE
jgi:tripartite-type tricarboxylate transporter receptor subunit TctC